MTPHKILALIKRDMLLYVVFFTGAVVLAVEVMAVRILSPFFGNTIFSFSSIISVILAALSVGYWRGGRMADRLPEASHFYRIVTRAGISVLVVQIVSIYVLSLVAGLFSTMSGPLIAALILFFYPSYLFGLLSPYVIKLRSVALPDRGVGAVSGEVFFASTVGSIFGSLLSGFVLIPFVGISTSMLAMALAVVVIGLVGGYLTKGSTRLKMLLTIGVVVVGMFMQQAVQADMAMRVPGTLLYREDGVYERISVLDTDVVYGQPGRVLMLDRSFSSGVTLPDGDLLFPYAKYYRLYRYFHPTLEHALVLGAGTGTVVRELHKDYPEATIDMVDIEPRLFDLAYEYFFLPESDKIVAHTADGRQFLRTTETEYDFVFGDMYSSFYSVPWHVSTREYYELLYSKLRDGGIYVGNYIATLDTTPPSLFGSELRTIREVFGNATVFAVDSPDLDSTSPQNIMILATKKTTPSELIVADLLEVKDPELAMFARHLVEYNPAYLTDYKLFTDDLAPVDLYTANTYIDL